MTGLKTKPRAGLLLFLLSLMVLPGSALAQKKPNILVMWGDDIGVHNISAVRWNDWKVHFAVINGNIATGTRDAPGWPTIVNLRADPYERAPSEAGSYIKWYAENIWLFVPIQNEIKKFLSTIQEYPFQEGSSLNAAGINYQTLKVAQALKRLNELESLSSPSN